jgi:uncharacterized protein YraI
MPHRLLVIAFVMYLCSASTPVGAETRLALLMGNADYRGFNLLKLATPTNDFRVMANVLKRHMSYTVFGGTDLSRDEMQLRIIDFIARVRDAGRNTTAIVFYSGHGMEVGDENFLFPVDAVGPFSDKNIRQKAISVTWLLNELVGAGAAVNVVILDACRNDGTKSRSKGFVPVTNPPGTIVAYATAPGQVAVDKSFDATGASPYSQVLARTIAHENWSAFEVLSTVRDEVYKITNGEQTPWERIQLQGRPFAFNPSIPLTEIPEQPIRPSRRECERHHGGYEVVDVTWWDHLNIRSEARHPDLAEPSNVVTKIAAGTKGIDVDLTSCDAEGWCRVRYQCSEGFSQKRYLRVMPESALATPATAVAPSRYIGIFSVKGVAASDVLNVREDPAATAPIMFRLAPSTQSVVVHYCGQPPQTHDNWCYISYDGRQGWVNGLFLRNSASGDAPNVQTLN